MTKKDNMREDLKGFEELFQDDKEKYKMPKKESKLTGLELINFLEQESKRLDKINEFFDYKIENTAKYNQTQALISKQRTENYQNRETLFKIFDLKDSTFKKSLAEVFDRHFKL